MQKIELKKFSEYFEDYSELRQQENINENISCLNGDVINNSSTKSSGISVRVNNKGNWGFAATSQSDDESVKKAIQKAQNYSNILKSKRDLAEELKHGSNADCRNVYTSQNEAKTNREVIAVIKDVDNYIAKKYPNLKSRYVGYNLFSTEKNILTTTESFSEYLSPKTQFVISMTMEKDGELFELYDVISLRGFFQDVITKPEIIYPKTDLLYNKLMDKTDYVYAEAGLKEVILDKSLVGILAHEAIGHTVEADNVLSGSIAADYYQKQVASYLVNITDFAHTAFGKTCDIPIYVDDEGTVAKDTVVIENGILKNFMHSKQTATAMEMENTGHARAYDYFDEPLVRMRNTAILPGSDKLDEMISSVKDGYYLIKSSNGQADTTSEFMFGVTLGYEIKNGKIGKAIKDTTISGVAFDMLKTVSMVSDEMEWESAGMCGKKQWIPVSMGGPSLKCKINIGGK